MASNSRVENWSRAEVEAIVDDYLAMLAAELAGIRYNKSEHRRRLLMMLRNRSPASIEFKHANISAILVEAGFPYISGYKSRSNYQALLGEVLKEKIESDNSLRDLASADVERPMIVPEVVDILSCRARPPQPRHRETTVIRDAVPLSIRLSVNYLEREARNRSLGAAGELFVLKYETARLIQLGKENLAAKIEHTSRIRGDGAGYDILSFEESGKERLIEVKTTRYGIDAPFYVSRNEVAVSKQASERYQVYRLFEFARLPRFYAIPGPIEDSCGLSPVSYRAFPKAQFKVGVLHD